jgi:hypothetical protein
MNWKRGGLMNNRYIYFGEGPCEVQILNALKENPSKIQPGKVVHLNVVQDLLPKSMILGFRQGTTIVFVFDTDVNETKHLKKNIELISKYCTRVRIVFLAQVLNFEDEIVRATDVKRPEDLTKSKGLNNFKSDFCKLKVQECRNMLERHHINVEVLWTKARPEGFDFLPQNSSLIKCKEK